MQQCNPEQAEPDLVGPAQLERRRHRQLLQIEVRLVETVEQHQAVDTSLIQPAGHVTERAEVRTQLDRHRNLHRLLHRAQRAQVAGLDVGGGLLQVGGQVVDVQLQRLGTGLLDLHSVVGPTLRAGGVETADDRDRRGFAAAANQVQVLVRPHVVAAELRKVAQGLAETLATGFQEMGAGRGLLVYLFLENRKQHDGRRAVILQTPDPVEIAGQRRGGGDDGMLQLQPKIASGQVHARSPEGTAALTMWW